MKFITILALLLSSSAFALSGKPHAHMSKMATLKRGGLISTVIHAMKVNKVTKHYSIEKDMTLENLSLKLGQKTIHYRISYRILDPSYPTIVGHFGFSGSIDEGNAKHFSEMHLKYFPNFNLLNIDTLSSKYPNLYSCYFSLGGLDDAMAIINAINIYATKTQISENPTPEYILLGGSGSSFGLFHGAIALNKLSDYQAVRGVYVQSGFNDLLYPYAFVKSLPLKKELKQFTLKERIIAKLLLLGVRKRYHTVHRKKCHDSQIDLFFNYQKQLKSSFDLANEALYTFYQQLYPDKEFSHFESFQDYLEKIAINKHLDEVNFPLLWLQSKNDPLSHFKEFKKTLLNANLPDSMEIEVYKKGGHSAYEYTFGKKWLVDKISDFLNNSIR
jgi:predicted alpha/beta-fold hydrolase